MKRAALVAAALLALLLGAAGLGLLLKGKATGGADGTKGGAGQGAPAPSGAGTGKGTGDSGTGTGTGTTPDRSGETDTPKDPDRSKGTAAGPAGGDGDIPDEVRRAIAGGPMPEVKPGQGETGDQFVAKPGGPTELDRRQEWVKRQERRNDLRISVMEAELGITKDEAARVRSALSREVAARVELYERLERTGAGNEVLVPSLAEIRAELKKSLLAELGPTKYDSYVAMEKAGKFALPEEKKKP